MECIRLLIKTAGMTFRNKYLFILFVIVCLAGVVKQWIEHNKTIDNYDLPKELSGQKETIDVRRVERNCDCAEWIRVFSKKDSVAMDKQEYFYIESTDGNDPPPTYTALADSGYILRLEGSFYLGKGVPAHYIQQPDQKPERARIFNYTSSQIVKPE
jgi:hypothetical protein